MKFHISNTNDRSLGATGTVHVDASCRTMVGKNRRAWEATPSEAAAATALCEVCK